jgi:hypothetical protein
VRLDPIILSAQDACSQQSEPAYFFQNNISRTKLEEPSAVDASLSDDHSELVPLLPIPNRTVKRLCADDSVRPYVKVGHRQTPYKVKRPTLKGGAFYFAGMIIAWRIYGIAAICSEKYFRQMNKADN